VIFCLVHGLREGKDCDLCETKAFTFQPYQIDWLRESLPLGPTPEALRAARIIEDVRKIVAEEAGL